MIFRPTGAASGKRSSGAVAFTDLGFSRFGGDFSVSGDGNGSGDADSLTVLSASTTGLQSAWGEVAGRGRILAGVAAGAVQAF